MDREILRIVCTAFLLTSVHGMDIDPPIEEQDIKFVQDKYTQYLNLSQQNTKGMDVHHLNKTLKMPQTLIELQKIDTKYINSAENSDGDILESILLTPEFLSLMPQGQQSVRHNINLLKKHININPIESRETGAHILHLLSRIWKLSHFKESRPDDIFCPNQSAAISLLLDTLRENSETGGGCYQGFAGRLACLYLTLIKSWMENKMASPTGFEPVLPP